MIGLVPRGTEHAMAVMRDTATSALVGKTTIGPLFGV